MNSAPLVALEIGTHTVRVVVGEAREDASLMITGIGECASRGVRKGEVVSMENALACVRTALRAAEDQAQVDIHEVLLLFTGGHVQSTINRGQVPVMNGRGEVSDVEIEAVMNNARAISLAADRETLHSITQHFYVDDQQGVVNPDGLMGARLSLDMLILHGVRNRIANMERVAEAAQVDVVDMAFGGLCCGLSVLNAEQKDRGVLAIDLGAGTTDYVVYADKSIAHAASLAVGGDHVTNDITFGLNVSTTQAEKLKVEHGCAMINLGKRTRTVPLSPESGYHGKAIRLLDLNTIIHGRMEELLLIIKQSLVEKNLLHQMGTGIVLTGGGAHMKDVQTLAERLFDMPCQVGIPRQVSGLAVATDGPDFAAPLGMLKYGFRTLDRTHRGFSMGSMFKSILGRGK